jgi:hypothetical protein
MEEEEEKDSAGLAHFHQLAPKISKIILSATDRILILFGRVFEKGV